MPALHNIDEELRIITTIWSGEATDSDLIEALLKYQQDIRTQDDYCSYHEIVDFSEAGDFKLSTKGLRTLVQIAAGGDVREIGTRLAIIVSSPFAYGLARMYETYRSFVPSVSKEVRIFKNLSDAREWIIGNPTTEP